MIDQDIFFEEKNGIGFITLNRPDVLNALSTTMCSQINEQLMAWDALNDIQAVVIKGAGDKAFCAGGDARSIVEQGFENNLAAKEFFSTEYKMNLRLYHFSKPYISLLDGITMGGGVGVSIHGSHRIITEKTLFAMPEASIGLIPDVGSSYFLPRLPGALGKYLGLTGARLRGADILYAGIGTAYMSSQKLDQFVHALCDEDINSAEDVDNIIARFAEDPGVAIIDEFRDLIDAAFNENTIEDIVDHLGDIDHDWAKKTIAVLKKMSPISLKVILEQLNCGKNLDFNECMIMEFRIVSAISSYDSDFYEGVRAVLIDKDHNPDWMPENFEGVTYEMVMAHFKAPNDGDLIF
ncbi:MAG: enoyl-CoA hydratase/isomerase family protein [Kordiimonadaceae bacterium]|jgi:enoyl-CoA hydratase|nr:enoyl-CoA hydratase/isomerase family protein [Kordiimonadaceae bacterium]